jgi:hypothetical protein
MSYLSLLKGGRPPSVNTSMTGNIVTQPQVSNVSLVSDSATTIVTVSNVSAGYYEIWGRAQIISSGGQSITQTAACVYSTATQSFGLDAGLCCQTFYGFQAGLGGAVVFSVQLPRQRITVLSGATTNIILAVQSTFTGSLTAVGYVCVERVA